MTRKNLMVDPEALAALAQKRGTSESEAVRAAVAQALAWERMGDALETLGRLGAFADTARVEAMYGPLPGSSEAGQATKPTPPTSPMPPTAPTRRRTRGFKINYQGVTVVDVKRGTPTGR